MLWLSQIQPAWHGCCNRTLADGLAEFQRLPCVAIQRLLGPVRHGRSIDYYGRGEALQYELRRVYGAA